MVNRFSCRASRLFRTLDSASNVNQPKRTKKLDAKDGKALLWPALILAMIVIADQGTKLWALEALADGIPYQALGRFLMFSLVFNEGGAMGTQLAPSIGYLIMALIVLPFVLFYLYRNRFYPAVSLPLAFIAGGAIGNLIDRIRLGRVVDFIDVDFFDINVAGFQLERWWTFNIADAAISCAIVFLIGHMILNRHTLDPEKPDQPAPETPSSDRA